MTRIIPKHELNRSEKELERIATKCDALAERLRSIAAGMRQDARLYASDATAALHQFTQIVEAVQNERAFIAWYEQKHGITTAEKPLGTAEYFLNDA